MKSKEIPSNNTYELYRLMLKCRLFEEASVELWDANKIHGELHNGIGEESIIAGVFSQLIKGDALASDHRGTSPFLLKGVDPVGLMLEFLGHEKGICGGMGGHMHLFSKENIASSSGIVGSSGPAAAGYAIKLKYKKSKNIAISISGEGSTNQGMYMEALNLASAWELPILFIVKDNSWAITTPSDYAVAGTVVDRAKGFGINGIKIDGLDPDLVYKTAKTAIETIRKTSKPYLIHATCVHKYGHFCGDPLYRWHDQPIGELKKFSSGLTKSMVAKKGASLLKRGGSITTVLGSIQKTKSQTKEKNDPVLITEKKLSKDNSEKVSQIKQEVTEEIEQIMSQVLEIYGGTK